MRLLGTHTSTIKSLFWNPPESDDFGDFGDFGDFREFGDFGDPGCEIRPGRGAGLRLGSLTCSRIVSAMEVHI